MGVHFLFVGGSHPHSRAHLKTLQHLPEVAAVTLVDVDTSVRDVYANEAKVQRTVATLGEGLQSGATHAFVCSRNDAAPADIEQCARAGLHILAEKPLATSMAAFEGGRQAVEEAGVTFSVMYQAREHPISLKARQLIRDGLLGRPIAAEARMVTSQVKFRNPLHWLFDRAVSGGGILSWLGCHYLDLLAYLLDDDYVSVAAHAGTLGGEAVDVEDVAMLSLRFSRGTLATMTAGYLLALSPSGYMHGAYDTHIGVYGTLGRLWWNPVEGKTLQVESAHPGFAAAPRQQWTVEVAESPSYGGVYGETFVRKFLAASQGKGEPPNTLRDGIRVLKVLDAVYAATQNGQGGFMTI